MSPLTTEQIWLLLSEITDPEIPVLSVVDLGMVRSVGIQGNKAIVVMTPTFAACPALAWLEEQIAHHLKEAGAGEVEVRWTLAPAWSTDWLTPQARQRLKAFGIAPPPRHAGQLEAALQEAVLCPYCSSPHTELKNDFGPTLCRAIYYCLDCHQPFERFKPI